MGNSGIAAFYCTFAQPPARLGEVAPGTRVGAYLIDEILGSGPLLKNLWTSKDFR